MAKKEKLYLATFGLDGVPSYRMLYYAESMSLAREHGRTVANDPRWLKELGLKFGQDFLFQQCRPVTPGHDYDEKKAGQMVKKVEELKLASDASYARFFTIGGKMQWDSIKDDGDLDERVRKQLRGDELTKFEKERANLSRPGGFIILPYSLIVRVE